MRYLLDTHILIWHFEDPEKLSDKVREDVLFNSKAQVFVSIVSLWEVAIKMNIGKYDFNGGFSAFHKLVNDNEFYTMPIKAKYMERLFALPLIHRDPFDRLIIAAALCENMSIITADKNIQKYEVPCIW